jgi:hypothetical protein
VADPTWISSIKKSLRAHPAAAAILGLSQTQTPHNPYAFATFTLNYLWKENGSDGKRVLQGEILDNKNIIYNKSFLTKHRLSFDEKRTYLMGSSEDCDLGERITLKGGECVYEKSIRVQHKDPTSFLHFARKIMRSYQGYLFYKGQKQRRHASRVRLKKILPFLFDRYHLSWTQQIKIYITLTIAILLQHYARYKMSD